MAKIKVSIINPTTLKLEEKGEIGDTIDLREIQSVDTNPILTRIKMAEDEVYQNLIANEVRQQNNLKQLALKEQETKFSETLYALKQEKEQLAAQINEQKAIFEQQMANALLQKTAEKTQEFNQMIAKKDEAIVRLEQQIKAINDQQSLLVEKEKNAIKSSFDLQISAKDKAIVELQSEIQRLRFTEKDQLNEKESQLKLLSETLKNKDDVLKNELEKQKMALELSFKDALNLKETELLQLRSAKSSLQVKMLGEELEKWCNSEYEAFALSGFEDCKWYKDNVAIKDSPDQRATKADYIFEVYANAKRQSEDKLITVVCEMKNESPDTKSKKKNSDHYKKLDDDRRKKNAQYALLISELEWDTINDAPIRKVSDYENMYMVRPAYFISFLSLLKSLAKKYKDLLGEHQKADALFKDSQDILAEFDKFKDTYLDKPLNSLVKDVESIKSEAQKSYDASYKILGLADTIITNKVETIRQKIERFDIKKIAKKIDKVG